MNRDRSVKLAAILFFSLSFLTGCSGGNGSSSGGAVAYTGKTIQAAIDSSNANKLFLSVWGGGPTPSTVSTVMAKSSQRVSAKTPPLKYISTRMRQILGGQPRRGKGSTSFAKPVNQTFNGAISGTATYAGNLNDDGTGILHVSYVDYNDGDGITLDGEATITINAYDALNELITNEDLQMVVLTFKSSEEKLSLSGLIHMEDDPASKTSLTVFSISGRNELANETFRLDNFSITEVYDDWFMRAICTETTTGRVYIESEGYVDVSQTTPFLYHYYQQFNVDVPDSGGSWIFSGAGGSQEKITPLSISHFQIEVDADGDGLFDPPARVLWSDLVGIVYTFKETTGTTGYEEGSSVQATSDGGYIAAGYTNSSTSNHIDVYLVKTNAIGKIEWTRTFGGANDEFGKSVIETSDGGCIVAGYSARPNSGGTEDVYVVRIDPSGNLLWEKKYDAVYSDWGSSIQEVSGGGFVIAGSTGSGWTNMFLLKIASNGDRQWKKTFGGDYDQVAYSVKAAVDGGYVMAGYTFNPQTGRNEAYVVKADADGGFLWESKIADTFNVIAYAVTETTDKGYVIAGVANNIGFLAKFDQSGNFVWEQKFSSTSIISSVANAPDDGFIMVGDTLIRANKDGEPLWERSLAGTKYRVQTARDGGFIISGYADVWLASINSIQKDVLLIKTDRSGNSPGTDYSTKNLPLTTIVVTPAAPNVTKGTTRQFTAIGTFADNSTSDITLAVTWTSSNTAASVSSSGLVTGQAFGTATITAASADVTGFTEVTVIPAVLSSIAITPAAPGIALGSSRQFLATGTYTDNSTQDITGSLSWTSSQTGVATIGDAAGSKGLAVSVAAGRTTITATAPVTNIMGSTTVAVGDQIGGALQGNPLMLTRSVSTLTSKGWTMGYIDETGIIGLSFQAYGIASDGSNLYIANTFDGIIQKMDLSSGQISVLAGTKGAVGSSDGTGPVARFCYPFDITTDGTNLYVADTMNNTIRKIVIASGEVTTLAGTANSAGSADGVGASARFKSPYGITTDGINLYVADTNNWTIRKIVISSGEVTTLAGTAGLSGSTDATGPSASFGVPMGVTTDGNSVFVADSGNNSIRKIIISSGEVSTLAGTPGAGGSADGVGAAALFYHPEGVTTDGTYLYVADSINCTIRKITISSGSVTTLAGTPGVCGYIDDIGPSATFNTPWGITTDGTKLYITDSGTHTIRRIE